MDLERARLAETLILDEVIHFMRQQTAASSSHQANKQMVLTVQPSEPEDVPLGLTLLHYHQSLPPQTTGLHISVRSIG